MATCVNCGAKIGAFDSSARPLYPGAQGSLCGKCYNAFKKKYADVEIPISFIEQNYDDLLDIGFTSAGIQYLEGYVAYKNRHELEEAAKLAKEQEEILRKEARKKFIASRESFKATTGYNFEGYTIVEYIGILSGEVVLGTGFLSELSAGVSDMFGIQDTAMTQKITDAKLAALQKLIDNCISKDANAAIGVDIDFMTIGMNMIVACANGTAVRIEKL